MPYSRVFYSRVFCFLGILAIGICIPWLIYSDAAGEDRRFPALILTSFGVVWFAVGMRFPHEITLQELRAAHLLLFITLSVIVIGIIFQFVSSAPIAIGILAVGISSALVFYEYSFRYLFRGMFERDTAATKAVEPTGSATIRK